MSETFLIEFCGKVSHWLSVVTNTIEKNVFIHTLVICGGLHDTSVYQIKGAPKIISSFFRPTSDVNISETVYPIYLKINVRRVASGDSLHINF